MTDDIQLSTQAGWGIITLTRPKALNALTADMCQGLDAALAAWADDPTVKAVLVEGEGDRAFCAGGDIRWLADTAKADPVEAASFFRREYRMNVRIHNYPKPYVALMDGITMGGGVGISASARHRVVTERTLWAMPECMIGLVPDVGGSFFLPRLPSGLGPYLGYTGRRLKGADLISAGLGTHYLPSEGVGALRDALIGIGDDLGPERIDAVLSDHDESGPDTLSAQLPEIAELFGDTPAIPAALERLEAAGSELAQAAIDAIRPASPTSLALTHRLLSEAPETFEACISREFRVAAHLMAGHDFREGVRAQIIDKDRTPHWQPAQTAELSAADIEAYFAEPAGGDLDLSGM